ncbi:MAG: collagen-like protein, partial [Nitrospirae bacterium]
FKVKGVYGLQVGVDDRGPMGPRGPKGDTGAAGAAGPMGPAGSQGPIGLAGATGATGPMGPQGVVGPMGPQGPAGAAGSQGPIGLTGPAGAAGPQGPAGVINDAAVVELECNWSWCKCPSPMKVLNYGVKCPDPAYAGLGNCWSVHYFLFKAEVGTRFTSPPSNDMVFGSCQSIIKDCLGIISFGYEKPEYIRFQCY